MRTAYHASYGILFACAVALAGAELWSPQFWMAGGVLCFGTSLIDGLFGRDFRKSA
jgi:hypothetical protein